MNDHVNLQAGGPGSAPPTSELSAGDCGADELHRAALRYGQLAESMPDALMLSNARGQILLVNGQLEMLTGFGRDELLGKPVELLVPAAARQSHEGHRQEYGQAPSVRPMGAGRDLLAQRKDGTIVPVEISLSPIESEDGMQVLVTLRDVTERRRVQQELRSLNERLEQRVAERTQELERRTVELERSNAELEQFAYVASHDLQEPLRMVASYVQLLARNYAGKLDADADEFIGYAVNGAARMQQLITDLLKFSRVGTKGKPLKRTSAGAALATALENLELVIGETHAEVTSDELPEVRGDGSQLVQLFQNLVGNGLKFCKGRAPRVHVGVTRQGDSWLFSVRDNGIGIEPQYAERIFVIFQRLHSREEYAGTGIGLALCRKIVERHGGKLWVESIAGEGSTFLFTIPDAGGPEP